MLKPVKRYPVLSLSCAIAILLIAGDETVAYHNRLVEMRERWSELRQLRSDAARERWIFISRMIESVGTEVEREFLRGAFVAGDPIEKLFERYRPDAVVREKGYKRYIYRGPNRNGDHEITVIVVEGKMVRAATNIKRGSGEFVTGYFFGDDWGPPFSFIADDMLNQMHSIDFMFLQFGLMGPVGVEILAIYKER